jgi:hypothetical protein
VAFRPTHPAVRAAAEEVLEDGALTDLLTFLTEPQLSIVP